jgi:hypothetical protein
MDSLTSLDSFDLFHHLFPSVILQLLHSGRPSLFNFFFGKEDINLLQRFTRGLEGSISY